MCVAPQTIPTESHPYQARVSCRKCWQCRANRVNDFVGRCIAEQKTSDQTLFVTLTYRGDVPEASYLNYPDIQKFLKRLRKNSPGRKVRYIVVGEYGSKKGRAHWHIILFIKGVKIPMARLIQDRHPSEAILNRRIDWKPWPHGLSYFQESDMKSFKYAVKYALKDQDMQVQRTHLSMSKKPPLGTQFFHELADAHVKRGLAPQTANYQFRDIFHKGKRLSFQLRGRARELYLDAYRTIWAISRGGPYPISDILEEREDELVEQFAPLPLTVNPDDLSVTHIYDDAKVRVKRLGSGNWYVHLKKDELPWPDALDVKTATKYLKNNGVLYRLNDWKPVQRE